MTLSRIASAVVLVSAAMAFRLCSCGGQIDEGLPGTLDDSGTFRAPDGRVLFFPGSACLGYDAAAYYALTSAPPACDDPKPETLESASCEAWAGDAGLSFGFAPFAQCIGGACTNFDTLVDTVSSRCKPGSDGDAYCRALYAQYTINGSRVSYYCNQFTNVCESDPASCNPVKGSFVMVALCS